MCRLRGKRLTAEAELAREKERTAQEKERTQHLISQVQISANEARRAEAEAEARINDNEVRKLELQRERRSSKLTFTSKDRDDLVDPIDCVHLDVGEIPSRAANQFPIDAVESPLEAASEHETDAQSGADDECGVSVRGIGTVRERRRIAI